ncbi:MAG: hypothetical protein EOO53_12860 [Gammaproteobacteria bacterium]|nr:MAG: hypothetical protein EOO53_12860 [Gammaproteobacteria bacterium]
MKKITILFLAIFSISCKASNFEELMVAPEKIVEEKTISEYPNIWWQWAYSIPRDINPVWDRTGENCHQGQSGNVWFLAGGFGSSIIKRKCEIPSGKYIFFPVINMVYWKPNNKTLSCDQAKEYAALNNDTLIEINIELDSKKASNPAHTRLSSEQCFNIFSRVAKNIESYDAYPSATDGFWIMLKPLSKGAHILKFQAKYNRENEAFGKMVQDIEYELIVN